MIKNFVWKGKKPKLLRTTLKKKNEVGGLTLHDLKTVQLNICQLYFKFLSTNI